MVASEAALKNEAAVKNAAAIMRQIITPAHCCRY
jgi:hypothetical protein